MKLPRRRSPALPPGYARRLHPLYFQKTFFRALPLFFLPVLRALLRRESPSLPLVAGSAALLLYFFLLWQQSLWRDQPGCYVVRHGLFLRRTSLVLKKWQMLPQRETSPLALFTGAVYFHPGTPAPGEQRIPLFRRGAPRFPRPNRRHRRASVPWTLLSAALLSNPASGLLLAAVFFRSVSSLLGQEAALWLANAADQRFRLIALGIPPAIAGISWLFLGGWLVSFLREALALLPFSWQRQGDRVFLTMGLWPHRESTLCIRDLGSVILHQSLPMALLGIYRAEGFVAGGGRVILHPSLNRRDRHALQWMYPDSAARNPDLRPHKRAWMSFLWLPAALLVLLALLEARALPVLDFLVPAFPLLFLPALWFLAIRILGSCLSGLSLRHGVVFLRSIRIFSVYSARIDPKHIIGVQYLQNPLQRFSGRCTLVLQTSGGWPAQYKLYHVPLKEARRWVQNSLGVSSGD